MSVSLKIMLIALTLLLEISCVAVTVSPIAHYTLTSQTVASPITATPKSKLSIFVNQPVATLGYQTNRIIYVTRPFELQAYASEQWVVPPARMLGHLIAAEMRQSNYFQAVITPPFSAFTDFRLETHLILLQQEYLANNMSAVHIVMWVGLVDVNTHKVIANRTFQVTMPAPANAYGYVIAANKAGELISKEISHYVIAQVSGRDRNS